VIGAARFERGGVEGVDFGSIPSGERRVLLNTGWVKAVNPMDILADPTHLTERRVDPHSSIAGPWFGSFPVWRTPAPDHG
jgi:hypothetical protein